MPCYLVDLPKYQLAFRIIANTSSKDDIHLVLIQDGVFIEQSKLPAGVKIYAMKPDADERGVNSRLKGIKMIDYVDLIDLIEKHPVKNFI